jgi:hypothetical protein
VRVEEEAVVGDDVGCVGGEVQTGAKTWEWVAAKGLMGCFSGEDCVSAFQRKQRAFLRRASARTT